MVQKIEHFGKYIRNPWDVWNLMLEKNGKDQLDWSCVIWSIKKRQGGEEYPTYSELKEG